MKFSTIVVTALFSLSAIAAPLTVSTQQDVVTRDEFDHIWDLVEREFTPQEIDEIISRGLPKKTPPPSRPGSPVSKTHSGSTHSGSIPSLATIKSKLKVHPSKTLFYAGPGGYIDIARKISHSKGLHILEDSWTDPHFVQPYEANIAGNKKFWDEASLALAEMSSGTVYVLLPENTKPPHFFEKAIWARIEWPALTKNSKVTKIIMIHPSGGAETVIWPSSAAAHGKSGSLSRSSSTKSNKSVHVKKH